MPSSRVEDSLGASGESYKPQLKRHSPNSRACSLSVLTPALRFSRSTFAPSIPAARPTDVAWRSLQVDSVMVVSRSISERRAQWLVR